MERFETPEYKRSRIAYTTQCTTEYLVTCIATGAFLAKLLSSIGISDSLVGIISSFVSLAFVFQIFSLVILNKRISAKKIVMIFDTASIFFFMLLFFVPFLPIGKSAKTIIIMLGILLAYFCKYLILNICFKWANSYVSPNKRASFSAGKEMASLVAGMIFSALMGYMLDKFEAMNDLNKGFLFVSATILILNLINFISLLNIKKDEVPESSEDNQPILVAFKKVITNNNVKSIVVLEVLWSVARYFSVGFFAIYKTKDLAMSLLFIEVINIFAALVRLIISKPFGRYSDRKTFAKGFELGLCIAAVSFLANVFTTPTTWFFIVIHTVLYNCAFAGTNQNAFNMVYSYVEQKYIVHAMSIKNCIGGLCGFFASILGGKILDVVQANNNMVFGIHMYGQQILSAISFLIIIVAIIFTRKVIEKQKIIVQ